MKILIASGNQGKIKEFEQLLVPQGFDIVTLADFPELAEVEETGTTFEENALLKAQEIADQVHLITISDDSGLIVPALNDEPGIYSARYSGPDATDAKNIQKVLNKLGADEDLDRSAYFKSVIVVAYPDVPPLVVEGRVNGHITHEVHGTHGFGYDPIFHYEPADKTFAQMSLEDKNKVSHRANALKELEVRLPDWLKENDPYEDITHE